MSTPRVTNIGFDGAPFATEQGFVVVSGVSSRATGATPTPFSYAVLLEGSESVEWKTVDTDGDRAAPVGPATGSTTAWIASQARRGGAQLYPVARSGELGTALPLTLSTNARVVALAQVGTDPLVIAVDDSNALVMARVGDHQSFAKLGVQSRRSASAVVIRAFGALLIGADKIGDSPGVALALLNPSAAAPVGAALAIGEVDSQRLRVCATDQGFVAVWNVADDGAPVIKLGGGRSMHGLSTMLAAYDCCSPR